MSEVKVSKKVIAIAAYNALVAKGALPARKDIVAHIVQETGASAACASTYLSNIVTGKWTEGGTRPAKAPKAPKAAKVVKSTSKGKGKAKAGLTIDAITAMNNKQLVEAYNAKASAPIVKFRDRQTGVKRVMSVYGLAGA